mgnify:CR=1 FL=1
MTVFRVMLNGARCVMQSGDEDVPCGFVKNEYVWAASESEAIEKAKQSVLSKLGKNSAIHTLSDLPILLEAEEVESRVAIWKLLSNEGFIFYKVEPESRTDR